MIFGKHAPETEIHATRFSPDRKYRYWLRVQISDRNGICMFLMLNPSLADEVRSDRTLDRCKNFARQWGYGALSVCNLFALRSPDPEILNNTPDPVGPVNDRCILTHARDANVIICAWGNRGLYLGRGGRVMQMLQDAALSHKTRHLGLTGRNQPMHPLYLNRNTRPDHFPTNSYDWIDRNMTNKKNQRPHPGGPVTCLT